MEEKGYRRLTKGQAVGLRYAGLIISLKDVKKDANGQVVELEVMCTTSATCTEKPKSLYSSGFKSNVCRSSPL